MSKMRVLELLPFFALVTIAAIVTSATLASAGFGFPDLFGKWSFGQPASPATDTAAKLQKSSMPLGDLTVPQVQMPFGSFSMFRSPLTASQKYSRTFTTPDGLQTQVAERVYDPGTGLWTTTVTDV